MVAWCCATVVLTSLIPAAILRRGGHDAVVPTSLVAIRAAGLMGSGRGLFQPLLVPEQPFHQFAGRCWSRHSLYPGDVATSYSAQSGSTTGYGSGACPGPRI